MRVEVVAWRTASGETKATAEGDVWRVGMTFLQGSGAVAHGMPWGSSEQAHVDAGVREHAKRPEWSTPYEESAKLFDESLQKS